MAQRPEVCVLKTDGINCEEETAHVFEVVGANPRIIHINELRGGSKRLANFGALAIPGGFSYGDDIASGQVLATEVKSFLADQVKEFIGDGKPVVGICNGFQTLVRTGLLPNGHLGEQTVTLTDNERGKFECRWIDLAIAKSACKFIKPEDFESVISMQVAHAEGRFYAPNSLGSLEDNGQIVFRYVNSDGSSANGQFPANPNGSMNDIAGITDPSGLILGMMPHPERSVDAFHPDRSRKEAARVAGITVFKNLIDHVKES